MPQMSPLNWIMLYMYFTSIFILFNMINYYLINYKKNKKKIKIQYKNWKW
uniref:ATP synthase F0 subunit 8 n=1 Tax=Pselaphinae sp. 2 EF-2015 TaxID=1756856 RepID=A0A0S2M8I2_9COLE|nr:ATP synthase F0 subunit 8 [Pselaphinae sp. 2 EF-2015]